MLIKDVLKLKGDGVVSIGPESTVPEAVAVMVERDIGSLVVIRSGKMDGLITFREILAALHRHRGDIHGLKIGEIMVRDPVTGAPEDTMDEVRAVMTERHVRYLPIVTQGELRGIVSFHDIARAALKLANFENRLLKQYIKNWPETS
jgi:CBS domain-containing protein